MMATYGGPLLKVADMLQDLSECDFTSHPGRGEPSMVSSRLNDSQESPAGVIGDLDARYKETYHKLNVALTQPGHSWTGLTQEICSTLATADQVLTSSRQSLDELSAEICKLQGLARRGQSIVNELHSVITTDEEGSSEVSCTKE